MRTLTVIPFSPPSESHPSRDASVMLPPHSGMVPARALLSPGNLKKGLLQYKLRVEIRLVGQGGAGLLDGPERAGRFHRVAGLVEVDVDPERRIARRRA